MSVCGTDSIHIILEVFLGRLFTKIYHGRSRNILPRRKLELNQCPGFSRDTFLAFGSANPIRRRYLYSPSLLHLCAGQGILTLCPSPPAFAMGLGPTNPSLITIAKETLIFRRAGISPALRLLVPAFSLPNAPAWLAPLPSSQMGTLSYHSK